MCALLLLLLLLLLPLIPPSCPAVTRGLQLAVLLPLFIGGYGQLAGCGSLGTWWAMAVLVGALLLIQAHTFVIYAGVWRRHGSAASLAPSVASSLGGGGGQCRASSSRASLPSPSSSCQTLSDSVWATTNAA